MLLLDIATVARNPLATNPLRQRGEDVTSMCLIHRAYSFCLYGQENLTVDALG